MVPLDVRDRVKALAKERDMTMMAYVESLLPNKRSKNKEKLA